MTDPPKGTAVFLGAGASKAFGLLLTNEILVRIVEKLRPGAGGSNELFRGVWDKTGTGGEPESELRNGLRALYPGLDLDGTGPDASAKLPNITDVLSLLDHLILYDTPAAAGFSTEQLAQTRRLLERAMVEVLGVLFTDFPQSMAKSQELAGELLQRMGRSYEQLTRGRSIDNEALKKFLAWLQARHDSAGPLTIVTTNYDLAVETALYESLGFDAVAGAIDFGFDWRHPGNGRMTGRPEQPEYRVFKLHGSLNWLRCALCGQLYVNPLGDISYLSFYPKQIAENTCHCGYYPLRHLIVAPSMVRDIRDAHLLNVWRCATEALRTAEEWIVIGYSMPAEDLAIRSMLMRAYRARGLQEGPEALAVRPMQAAPRVTVVQRGRGAEAAFQAIFPGCDYRAGGLEEFMAG